MNRVADTLRLAVRDQGTGIDAQYLGRISAGSSIGDLPPKPAKAQASDSLS